MVAWACTSTTPAKAARRAPTPKLGAQAGSAAVSNSKQSAVDGDFLGICSDRLPAITDAFKPPCDFDTGMLPCPKGEHCDGDGMGACSSDWVVGLISDEVLIPKSKTHEQICPVLA